MRALMHHNYCGEKSNDSAKLTVDLDLLPDDACRTVKRRVPMRTILFFSVHFKKLDYWRKRKVASSIHDKLHIPESQGLILILERRRNMGDYHIDKYWNNMISELIHRELQLETEMWRLSTLGGAVSAMGFFNDKFVTYAMKVSARQLEIAKMLQDPILIARCYLYISLSLAQRRHYQLAAEIVRLVWRESNKLKSDLLRNCAQGVWTTIKWMKEGSRKRDK